MNYHWPKHKQAKHSQENYILLAEYNFSLATDWYCVYNKIDNNFLNTTSFITWTTVRWNKTSQAFSKKINIIGCV